MKCFSALSDRAADHMICWSGDGFPKNTLSNADSDARVSQKCFARLSRWLDVRPFWQRMSAKGFSNTSRFQAIAASFLMS
jgi:hypothetical protein